MSNKPEHVNVTGKIETHFPPELLKKYDTSSDQQHTWNRKQFWSSLITIILLFSYTTIAAWQGCSNKKAADAAQSAATTARDTLTSATQQFRLEQRPFMTAAAHVGKSNWVARAGVVTTTPVFFDPSGNGFKVMIAVDVTNSGKSPAIGTTATLSHVLVGPSDEVAKQSQEWRPDYPSGASNVVTNGSYITVHSELPYITKDQHDKIVGDHSWSIYIVGAVRYRDIYQPTIDPYETTYCFIYNPTNLPFGNCFWGNVIK